MSFMNKVWAAWCLPTHGSCMEVLHSSYTMGTHGSPDIYTLSPRACRLWALGVYIRQTTCAHGITIKYTISPWITAWAFISLQECFTHAPKWDRHLIVEDLCAVYNLWCPQWILMKADDAWSTILCVLLCYSTLYPGH